MSRYIEIWRYALAEGRVTCKEVEEKFNLKQCSGSGLLLTLHERGELVRFPKERGNPKSRVQYGVTSECKVPRGVKIKEIIR